MAQLKTYRVWFMDDSAILVCAKDEAEARRVAHEKSVEHLANAYFGSQRAREQASKVESCECLD